MAFRSSIHSRRKSSFCLWVVPPNDGRVRKVRLTLRRAVCGSVLAGAICGVLIFIAGDYARVQVLRAKNFISLQLAQRERDRLEASNQTLESQVSQLKSVHGRVLSYEQSIKQRLDELALIVQSSEALGLLRSEGIAPGDDVLVDRPMPKADVFSQKGANKKYAKRKESIVEGIGGGERDCEVGECEEFKPTSFEPSFAPQPKPLFIPAALNLNNPLDVEGGLDGAQVVKKLDYYIDQLKNAPLGVPAIGHISSGFGYRYSPFGGKMKLHEGVDFSLTVGDQVLGAGDGIVKEVRRCATYGLMVDIAHSDNVVTRYAHLSKAFVSEGEKVCRGEVIAAAGSTGHSTGPHLHYEILIKGQPINPITVIALAQRLSQVML